MPPVSEARKRGGNVGCQGDRTDLAALRGRQAAAGVRAADADPGGGEVDVSPAQGDKLAAAEAGKRGGEEDRRVLLGLGCPDQGPRSPRVRRPRSSRWRGTVA